MVSPGLSVSARPAQTLTCQLCSPCTPLLLHIKYYEIRTFCMYSVLLSALYADSLVFRIISCCPGMHILCRPEQACRAAVWRPPTLQLSRNPSTGWHRRREGTGGGMAPPATTRISARISAGLKCVGAQWHDCATVPGLGPGLCTLHSA